MDKEKDLEKKRNYGEEYQKLLKEKGYLFVNEAIPAESYNVEDEIVRMAYQEFLKLRESDERVEFIDGKIYYMASPNVKHQRVLRRLSDRFSNYLHGKKCEAFVDSLDVRIDFDFGGNSHVEPDLIVICDEKKLDKKGLNGAPEFALEVLSPSNRSNDLVRKYNKYREVGVREYWIVDPEKDEIMVNLLSDDKSHYITKTYKKGEEIKVHILDNLIINMTDTFDGYQGKEIVEVEVARIEERVEMAKKMLADGLSVEEIVKYSGLAVEVVKSLLEKE